MSLQRHTQQTDTTQTRSQPLRTGKRKMMQELVAAGPKAMDFTVRPAKIDDVEAANRLFVDCAVAMTGQPDTDPEEILNEWQLPEFELAKSTRVVLTPDNQLVGYIEVWDIGSLPVNVWVWARVHPDFEGLGIGTQLMKWAERRARQALGRVSPELRVVMEAGTYTQNTDAKELLTNLDMKPIRRFLTMAIELDDRPVPAEWPGAIEVRPMIGLEELPVVVRAVRDAFKDHWGFVDEPFEEEYGRWLHFLENKSDFDPDLWFLAMEGNEVAGMSLCWPKSNRDPAMGWVGTLGVRRKWRRQGLGLALLRHSFQAFHKRGSKRAGLGVDSQSLTGAIRLYEKAGMEAILQFDVFQKELRAGKDMATRRLME